MDKQQLDWAANRLVAYIGLIAALIGWAAVVWGVWQWSPAAAKVTAGVGLMTWGNMLIRATRKGC